MQSIMRTFYALFLLLALVNSFATAGLAPGRLLGKFDFTVAPRQDGQEPIPLRAVNRLERGTGSGTNLALSIRKSREDAKISLVLVPSPGENDGKMIVLEPRKAGSSHEWVVPCRIAVAAVVFGPTGLDHKKIDHLLERNHDLVPLLAEYAEQTGRSKGLLDLLSNWEQNPTPGEDLNAVLSGFATRNGLPVPKLDSRAPTDQQAVLMLRTLVPTLSGYDPLTAERSTAIQQSTGLVASVAGLFFGTPVGLVAGGAALFQNFRTILYPGCEFRTALSQGSAGNTLALYAKPQPSRSRTRLAYLWATRIPDQISPKVSLATPTVYLPAGLKSSVKVTATGADLRTLSRTRSWKLVSDSAGISQLVDVQPAATLDTLTLNLADTALAPGSYSLQGQWDWDIFAVQGTLEILPLSDLSSTVITDESRDRLVEQTGTVTIELHGTDFQFVEKLGLEKPGGKTQEVSFRLPKGSRAGIQTSLQADIDTNSLSAGTYRLCLHQSGDQLSKLALVVHPPHPRLRDLPIRLNLGESSQVVRLEGSGLDRIEAAESASGNWAWLPPGPDSTVRNAVVSDLATVHAGDLLDLSLKVQGIARQLVLRDAVRIAGPRPRIAAVGRSLIEPGTVMLEAGEIPEGSVTSFSIRVENADGPVAVELRCGEEGKILTLVAGQQTGQVRLETAGANLFLSLDPAGLGSWRLSPRCKGPDRERRGFRFVCSRQGHRTAQDRSVHFDGSIGARRILRWIAHRREPAVDRKSGLEFRGRISGRGHSCTSGRGLPQANLADRPPLAGSRTARGGVRMAARRI
jgi:hypothetical protein